MRRPTVASSRPHQPRHGIGGAAATWGEPMSDTTPERGRSNPGTAAPFAELVAELGELGFEPQPRPALPGQVVYAATDSPATIAVVTRPAPAVAGLQRRVAVFSRSFPFVIARPPP